MDKISNLLKMLLAMAGYNHSWIGCLECELCLPVAMQNIPPSLAHGIRNFFPSCLRNLAGAVHVQTRGQVLETAKAAGPGRITHADQTSFPHGLIARKREQKFSCSSKSLASSGKHPLL